MSVASARLNCGQSVCRLSSDSVTALLVQVERHTLTGGPHPAIAGSNVIVKPQTWQFSQRSIVRPHTYSVAAVGSRDGCAREEDCRGAVCVGVQREVRYTEDKKDR